MEEIVAQKRMSKYNEQHSDLKKREESMMKWLVGKWILNFMVSKKVSKHLPFIMISAMIKSK